MTETNVPEGYVDLSDQAQPMPRVVAMGTYLHVPDNSRFVSKRELARQPATRSAVFLDRDGVIVEDVHYL